MKKSQLNKLIRGTKKRELSLANQQKKNKLSAKVFSKITQVDRIQLSGQQLIYPTLIFPSQGTFKQVWDIIIGIFVLYTSFLSPIDIAFEFDSSTLFTIYRIADYFVLAFFCFDIIINFRTTFYDQDKTEIIDSKLIIKNYLKQYSFYIDLLSTIPVSELADAVAGASINASYTRILKQFKLFRILRLAKLTKFFNNENLKIFFIIFQMMFGFVVVFHWLTCIWYFIAKQDYDPQNQFNLAVWVPTALKVKLDQFETEMSIQEIFYEQLSNFDKYSFSLYSLITFILGNDVQPVNMIQGIICILLSIAGQFTMSLFFGNVALLTMKLNEDAASFQQKLDEANENVKNNDLPKEIQIKIIEYLKFSKEKKILNDNLKDFSLFSRPLQVKINLNLKGAQIKQIPFFQTLEMEEIIWIIRHLKQEIFLPDDFIIRQGEEGDCCYLLQEGKVKIMIKKDDFISKEFIFRQGSFFGEISLINQSKRTSDVIALDFCICETFSRNNFKEMQKIFPGITFQLSNGFNHYKNANLNEIIEILGNLIYFQNCDDQQLEEITKDYLQFRFMEQNRLIVKPKQKVNGFYILLDGKILKLMESPQTQQYLNSVIMKKCSLEFDKLEPKVSPQEDYLDFKIKDLPKDASNFSEIIYPGQFFGCKIKYLYFSLLEFPLDETQRQGKYYYISYSDIQILYLNKKIFQEMKLKNEPLYLAIRENYQNLRSSEPNETISNSSGLINNFLGQYIDEFEYLVKMQVAKQKLLEFY